jgi:S-DNA-T family DNA segregation ATPase FtsK/SpoIIIE
VRVVIRGSLASWAARRRPSFNQSEPSKEDDFVAQISIADIRREIARACGPSESQAASSTMLAGRIFHEVLAGMMGDQGWRAALEAGELADVARLTSHVYEKLLGPRITGAQASLRECGAETLVLWEAARAMCAWMCRILETASQRGLIGFERQTRAWTGAERLCRPEYPLEWEIRETHWTAPVLVSGVADAIWLNPEDGRWCVVEYKLGQGRAEADLAQACLYHAMLSASELAPADGSLAVFSFRPRLDEQFYSSEALGGAQTRLRALIGRLAGVLPEQQPQALRGTAQPDPAHVEIGQRLLRALQHYGVQVQWNGELTAGPTFLRYPVMPGRKVRIKSIIDRSEDLQVQLALEQPPLIHNAGGRLVLDVQRPDRQTVSFSSIASQIPPRSNSGSSLVPLGVDLSGSLKSVDLASPNTPHLLVAGTSGSGKSEWLRAAVAGMILSNTPATLRLVLIDPKRTAFTELKDSPYSYGPKGLIYPPEDSAIETLEALIEEMEDRYRRLSSQGVSDIAELSAKTGEVLPRIVCVCDEYADLIADRVTAKEVEGAISRLGAKARAAGIHLIIATQYPDRKTVGGALKMNLGGRVCLRTTTHVQSNMIINESGAERLLGKGDLFFLSIGSPERLQAPYLSAEDRARVFGGAGKQSFRAAES